MIREFISQVKTRGIARTNRYEVLIPGFPAVSTGGTRLLTTFCDAVNLPGMNYASTPNRFYGDPYEMPYERMFDPVTLSFYMDAGFELKAGFDKWISQIINPTNHEINYYKNYTRDIEIRVLNIDEWQSPYMVTLFEAYPKSINSIQLDAASRDVMKFTVTMQYRYWKPIATISQAQAKANNPFDSFRDDPINIRTSTGVTQINMGGSRENR